MSEKKQYTAYFRGSLTFEAKNIEEAWDYFEKEIENIEIDDLDILLDGHWD